MTAWSAAAADAITTPQEVQVVTRRKDGTLRSPGRSGSSRVAAGSSSDPPTARAPTGTGPLWPAALARSWWVRRPTRRFVKADEEDLAAADHAYRAKYGHYARIVDHLVDPAPRSATVEVQPA